MKILLVVHTFLPKYLGGTEVCTYELAKQYTKLGHEVIVFCTDPLSNEDKLRMVTSHYQGIKIYTILKDITKYKEFSETYYDIKVIKPFKKIVKNFKPDIIHYHHLMHLSTEIVDYAKKNKIPQIVTLHDFFFQCITHQRITTTGNLCKNPSINRCSHCLSDLLNAGPIINTTFNFKTFISSKRKQEYLTTVFKKIYHRINGKMLYNLNSTKYKKMVINRNNIFKKTLTEMDLVIFPTKFLSNEFIKWHSSLNNTLLSYDGINTNAFKKFKRKSSKILRFGYIGSIIPTKGLDMILKAWPKLIKGNYNLKIYGNLETDKKYANTILQLSKKLKNIKFCGTFPPDKISEIYSNIDILLVPSRWFENAPLVVRNALHTKTPVIAVNIGSNPELIKNYKNGLLYENEDLNGLIKQMNYCITNKKKIFTTCNNYLPQKSIEDNAGELINIYDKLIHNGTKK